MFSLRPASSILSSCVKGVTKDWMKPRKDLSKVGITRGMNTLGNKPSASCDTLTIETIALLDFSELDRDTLIFLFLGVQIREVLL